MAIRREKKTVRSVNKWKKFISRGIDGWPHVHRFAPEISVAQRVPQVHASTCTWPIQVGGKEDAFSRGKPGRVREVVVFLIERKWEGTGPGTSRVCDREVNLNRRGLLRVHPEGLACSRIVARPCNAKTRGVECRISIMKRSVEVGPWGDLELIRVVGESPPVEVGVGKTGVRVIGIESGASGLACQNEATFVKIDAT